MKSLGPADLIYQIQNLEKLAGDAGHLLMRLAQGGLEKSPEMFELAIRCSRMIRSAGEMHVALENHLSPAPGQAEIEKKLAEFDILKKNQDADYFLSAQLLKPFAIDMLVCDTVEAQTLTRQKRKFKFGRWVGSIGGDISFIYPVVLENRSYTLLANADAMGKSIQGAGGALVFAAVLKGITERTAINDFVAALAPEFWLRDALIELQKVFQSFDGSMLITAFLGLLDNSTGALYFINAEHPKPVLLRSGHATFLDAVQISYRIGLNPALRPEEARHEMQISTVRLLPGDAVICATDGRDDLAMGNDADGVRVINQDEGMFAQIVEAQGGDIEKIFDVLTQKGELIDDVSFLKIQYYGTGEPETAAAEVNAMVRDAREAYFQREWEKALHACEEILGKEPLRFYCQRLRVLCLIQLKRQAEAASLARKLKILDGHDQRTRRLLKYFSPYHN